MMNPRLHHIFRMSRGVLSHPAAPVMTALLFHLYKLGDISLWADEGATYGIARLGLRPYEHPSLYFRFMQYWILIFGSSEWSLRMPSVISASLLPWIIYMIGRQIFGSRTALLGAWLTVFSPFIHLGAQEARMYASLALFQSAALLGLMIYINGKDRGLILWCAGTVVASRLHHLGWLGCWPPFIASLFYGKKKKRAYATGLTVLIIYGPLWVNLYEQIIRRIGGGHLGTTPGVMAAIKKLIGQVYYMGAGFLFSRIDIQTLKEILLGSRMPLFILLAIIPTIGFLYGIRSFIRGETRWIILLVSFFLPSFLFIAYEGSPANLLLPVYGVYLVVLTAGCRSLGRYFFTLLMIAWFSASILQSQTHGYPVHPEDWRGLSEKVRSLAHDGDAVYLTGSRNSYFITEYYSLGDLPKYSAVDSTLLFADYDPHQRSLNRSLTDTIRRLVEDHHRLWFVYIDYDMPFMERTLDTLSAEYFHEEWTFESGLLLYLFEDEHRK